MDEDRTPDAVRHFLDTCVQCRGCEPACPSGVPYGRILGEVNRRDELAGRRSSLFLRSFLWVLRRPRLLDVVSRLGLIAGSTPVMRVLVPKPLRITGIAQAQGPRIRRSAENPDVWLFTGCVMNTWFRNVHRATLALIEATGESVATPVSGGECCGALHVHSGAEVRAVEIAKGVMASMPGDAPILVNSAGCGAALKEYGELLGTDEAQTFSARVLDVHEWIDARSHVLLGQLGPKSGTDLPRQPVVVQEPCHLRHVQKIPIADVVERFTPVIRLDDDGLCCGAGGAYSLAQPAMARSIRDRKTASIQRADPSGTHVVVTGNPGCHLHLAADGHSMRSSVEVIADALGLSTNEEGVRS
jgi:glycolate oxidase iron-sulfur subunit